MRALLQRVSEASVEVEGQIIGAISHGLLIFLGVGHQDSSKEVEWLKKKVIEIRIFEDEMGKTNRSLLDVKGSVLIISQFTLYADCNDGRRPSFTNAANPAHAKELYEQFIHKMKESVPVQTGSFGASMKVSLKNEGPFTLFLEKLSS